MQFKKLKNTKNGQVDYEVSEYKSKLTDVITEIQEQDTWGLIDIFAGKKDKNSSKIATIEYQHDKLVDSLFNVVLYLFNKVEAIYATGSDCNRVDYQIFVEEK